MYQIIYEEDKVSDSDQTVYSSGSESGTPKRNPLLIIGGIGCALLLCVALLIGGGVFLARDQIEDTLAGLTGEEVSSEATDESEESATTEAVEEVAEDTATEEAEATTEPEEEVEEVVTEEPIEEATEEPEPEETEEPEEVLEPKFADITFALGATKDYDPIDAGDVFEEGVTEIHAIFDYEGMSPDFTWQRVWYLDGEEILSNEAEWTGDKEGRFDYFIDAGGEELAPGEWTLELYVDDELLAEGTFEIEAAAIEVAEATATSTRRPTSTPAPTATPTTAAAASSGSSGGSSGGGGTYQLAFTKWDGGQHNLYVADTNGNNEQFVFGRAAGPSWTPDGQTIFFFGEEGVDRQSIEGVEYVFDGVSNGVIALDASPLPENVSQAQLFQGLDWKQGSARWTNVSPDGQMIAFDARPGGDYRIYFLGTADNQQFRFEIIGEQADWAPNSEQVVYRSGRDGKTGIWISNRDDSGHTLLTNGGSDSFPSWSPDGRTIAFSRDEGGNVDIYTINVDGTNLQRLTDAQGPDTLPEYTPSGDIIFRSARSGSWAIWKMSGSGGNQTEIISDAGVGPDWTFSRMSIN